MAPNGQDGILYLSRADIQACAVSADTLEEGLRQAFLRRAEGHAWSHRKVVIGAGGRDAFRGKGAAMDEPAFGALSADNLLGSNLAARLVIAASSLICLMIAL